ncbi:class I SAM-dependent methyltransferase [Oryzobacter sp. R7]|uniref:class I SAM-dependent methyltransferase n=1 Tax=Oryzobacter faecalis TaxID=3388656 RepID=UPI00398D5EFF
MTIRQWAGERLDRAVGADRVNRVRRLERRVRDGAARRIELTPRQAAPRPKPATATTRTWTPPDPFTPHPTPTVSRHELLTRLHELLQPRTYLEVGVNDGASLALSRTRTVAVDPFYSVVKEVRCDLHLVRATSDDFFARPDAVAHFEGVPVDLAFIDGMHLSDFVVRDVMNTEPLMARTGVVVLDDVLPRNALEASRTRLTHAWTGDVYKAVDVLLRHRPDLVVLLVNTAPTGTAVVVSLDAASTVLREVYDGELDGLLSPDPQSPPLSFMDRSTSVDPDVLLASPVWARLRELREDDDADLAPAWDELRALPRLG